jgi:hypothetical protein
VDLTPFVDQLRRDLACAAEAGSDELRAAAATLATAADPALRMILLDVLVAAADELTAAAGAVVEVRLRGRDVELVTHPAPAAADTLPPPSPLTAEDTADEGTARVSLRLPEALKARAERAAAGEGVSLNTWLVHAVSAATGSATQARRGPSIGRRLSGWAQS